MPEYIDFEARYRRGYENDASDTVKAVDTVSSRPIVLGMLTRWPKKVLFEWRHHERVAVKSVKPPLPLTD